MPVHAPLPMNIDIQSDEEMPAHAPLPMNAAEVQETCRPLITVESEDEGSDSDNLARVLSQMQETCEQDAELENDPFGFRGMGLGEGESDSGNDAD